ncbi:MAG: sigma-70 family RNA polymerase sigma factor [Archangium sp.]
MIEEACAQWNVDAKAFEKWLGARRSAPQVEALALVFACVQGKTPAIRHLEDRYFPKVRGALKKMNAGGLEDELIDWLRFELFAREQGPLLSTYSGKGDLTAFLRAIAVHEALKRLKKQKREVDADAVEELPMPQVELAAMKGAYGKEFTRALDESFRSLEVTERNLLRQYFLDGLSIDALAKLYDIHRATAARRVTAAKEKLTDRVKARLIEQLNLGESSVQEVITLSNLDESLSTLLRKSE